MTSHDQKNDCAIFQKKIIILPKSSCKSIFLLRRTKFDHEKQNNTPQQEKPRK